MDNHDIAKKVISYFDKKTKTPLSEGLLSILLVVSHAELEKVIISQYLFDEKNEYPFLCHIYQQWQKEFQLVSRTQKKGDVAKAAISKKDVEDGLKLFEEIDALNVFKPVKPPLFLNI